MPSGSPTPPVGFTRDYAQAFQTGPSANGYVLTRIFVYADWNGDRSSTPTTYSARIHLADGETVGEEVGSLSSPAINYNATLTAPDGIDLRPNTTYFLVLDLLSTGSDRAGFSTTRSTFEEDSSSPGWEIGDVLFQRNQGSGQSWTPRTSDSRLLRLDYYGSVVPVTEADDESAFEDSEIVTFGGGDPGAEYTFNGETRTVEPDGSYEVRVCTWYDFWGRRHQRWGGTGPCPP